MFSEFEHFSLEIVTPEGVTTNNYKQKEEMWFYKNFINAGSFQS
jgi:hypothetical protein